MLRRIANSTLTHQLKGNSQQLIVKENVQQLFTAENCLFNDKILRIKDYLDVSTQTFYKIGEFVVSLNSYISRLLEVTNL